MSFLLRKFSLAKWEQNRGLQTSKYTADAITGCTRTSGNTLSVWQSQSADFTSVDFELLAVGLAISLDQPATIDLIWLKEAWLLNNGIDVIETGGNSKLVSINNLHRDLSNLDYAKLGLVGDHIVERMKSQTNFIRLSKAGIIKLAKKHWALGNGFSIDQLSDSWQKALV